MVNTHYLVRSVNMSDSDNYDVMWSRDDTSDGHSDVISLPCSLRDSVVQLLPLTEGLCDMFNDYSTLYNK